MRSAELVNVKGEVLGKVGLREDIFSLEVNPYLIHEAFVALRASERRGVASTKTRKEVSGGGIKLRQIAKISKGQKPGCFL